MRLTYKKRIPLIMNKGVKINKRVSKIALLILAFDWPFGPILAILHSRKKSDIGVDSRGQTSGWILEGKISEHYILGWVEN